MSNKSDAVQSLKNFVMEPGVPEELTVDVLKEQNSPGTEFMKCCQRNCISLKKTKPERQN